VCGRRRRLQKGQGTAASQRACVWSTEAAPGRAAGAAVRPRAVVSQVRSVKKATKALLERKKKKPHKPWS